MIATVKLIRPDELLSLIREAADLPAHYGPADAARERHNVCFWHKADMPIVYRNASCDGVYMRLNLLAEDKSKGRTR